MSMPARAIRWGAVACGLGLAPVFAATGPAAAAPSSIAWDCQANPPIGSSQHLTLHSTVDAQAPADVLPGGLFDVVLTPGPQTVPATAGGYSVNNLHDLRLRVPVPAGTSYQSATLSGGASLGGTPSVSQSGGVVTVSVPGSVPGGATFQLPALHLTLQATGAPGSTIATQLGGTSYSDPGLGFTANVHVSPLIDPDVPTSCFPNPNPPLATTTVDQPAATPATAFAPALGTEGNRTVSVVTRTDGRIFYDWWDLGGGGHGWREVPGNGGAVDAPAVALVGNGTYAFAAVRGGDGAIYLNQGTLGGTWYGWSNTGVASNFAPALASNGNRTIAVVTATDGRLLYTWWDLGGAGHPWTEVPGGGRGTSAPAVSLVGNGTYAFLGVRGGDGTVTGSQGTVGGGWIGWTSTGVATNVAPSYAGSGNRTMEVVTTMDGQIHYDWWDLGGGGHGWRDVPGGFKTDAPPGVGLVANGAYAFVSAKSSGTGLLMLNQGDPTTGSWVGWR